MSRYSFRKIASIHRLETTNLGDLLSAPHRYFDWLDSSTNLDIKAIFPMLRRGAAVPGHPDIPVIVGGGGLFGCSFFADEIEYLRCIPNPKIVWGAGLNSDLHGSNSWFDLTADGTAFDLVGLRDYPNAYSWVPCASCLHPAFSVAGTDPTHDVVIYLTVDNRLGFDSSRYLPDAPTLVGRGSIEETTSFLLSGNLVLTNSYHGAYWAQLLGRKVIAFPHTSKFFHLRFPIPLCTPRDWRDYLRMAYCAPDALVASRAANYTFAERVRDFLSLDHAHRRSPPIEARAVAASSRGFAGFDLSARPGTAAEVVQKKLLSRIVCPRTWGPIEVLPTVVADRAIREGLLISTILEECVGRIHDFQIDFLVGGTEHETSSLQEVISNGALPIHQTVEPTWTEIAHYDERIVRHGAWVPTENGAYLIGRPGSVPTTLTFRTSRDCELRFGAHPWSGIITITVDGLAYLRVDLYQPYTGDRTVPLQLGPDEHRVDVLLQEKNNPNSSGYECLFGSLRIQNDDCVPVVYNKKPRTDHYRFGPRFWELLGDLDTSGVALDIAGAGCQIDDPRYAALEYVPMQSADLLGQPTAIPLRSNSIDLVYAADVLEHVPDPLKVGHEIVRILKRGGKALIGVGFMQPLHRNPRHFFNMTRWGLGACLQGLRIESVRYESSLASLFEWCTNASGLATRIDAQSLSDMRDTLTRLDNRTEEEAKMYVANSIWVEARK
jgi:SAM-dependent methyltransferase